MTIKEFLSMPQGYTPEQWQKELKHRKRIEVRLRKLSTDRDFLEDSYAMTGEMKIKEQLDEIISEMDKLRSKLDK